MPSGNRIQSVDTAQGRKTERPAARKTSKTGALRLPVRVEKGVPFPRRGSYVSYQLRGVLNSTGFRLRNGNLGPRENSSRAGPLAPTGAFRACFAISGVARFAYQSHRAARSAARNKVKPLTQFPPLAAEHASHLSRSALGRVLLAAAAGQVPLLSHCETVRPKTLSLPSLDSRPASNGNGDCGGGALAGE